VPFGSGAGVGGGAGADGDAGGDAGARGEAGAGTDAVASDGTGADGGAGARHSAGAVSGAGFGLPPQAADFWGEASAAVQDALQGPPPAVVQDALQGPPPAVAHPPRQRQSATPRFPRRISYRVHRRRSAAPDVAGRWLWRFGTVPRSWWFRAAAAAGALVLGGVAVWIGLMTSSRPVTRSAATRSRGLAVVFPPTLLAGQGRAPTQIHAVRNRITQVAPPDVRPAHRDRPAHHARPATGVSSGAAASSAASLDYAATPVASTTLERPASMTSGRGPAATQPSSSSGPGTPQHSGSQSSSVSSSPTGSRPAFGASGILGPGTSPNS
jgi:hypothetical protein